MKDATATTPSRGAGQVLPNGDFWKYGSSGPGYRIPKAKFEQKQKIAAMSDLDACALVNLAAGAMRLDWKAILSALQPEEFEALQEYMAARRRREAN